MKESDERFDKQMGRFGNRLGEIIEYMVMPNLITKFNDLGFVFTKAYPHATIEDKKNVTIQPDIRQNNKNMLL
jgi:hypothetical protein